MVDPIRRKILVTGATAMAAAPQVFSQPTRQEEATGSFYREEDVRIRYEETGSGFPLLLTESIAASHQTYAMPMAVSPWDRSRSNVRGIHTPMTISV